MNGWNTIVSYWGQFGPSFRGKLAVSFGECRDSESKPVTTNSHLWRERFEVWCAHELGSSNFHCQWRTVWMPRFLPGKWKMTTPQNDLKTSFTSKLVFMFWKLFFSAMKQKLYIFKKGEMRTSRTRRSSNTNLRRPSGSTLVYPSGSALVVDTQAPPVAQAWNIALWLARMMCTNFTKNYI